jgi:hypothetical protein
LPSSSLSRCGPPERTGHASSKCELSRGHVTKRSSRRRRDPERVRASRQSRRVRRRRSDRGRGRDG